MFHIMHSNLANNCLFENVYTITILVNLTHYTYLALCSPDQNHSVMNGICFMTSVHGTRHRSYNKPWWSTGWNVQKMETGQLDFQKFINIPAAIIFYISHCDGWSFSVLYITFVCRYGIMDPRIDILATTFKNWFWVLFVCYSDIHESFCSVLGHHGCFITSRPVQAIKGGWISRDTQNCSAHMKFFLWYLGTI